jgi:riboflavin synthase
MFTGLVETVGRIDAVTAGAAGRRVRIGTPIGAELSKGESIAVGGVCLTVTDADPSGFWADLSLETLRVSALAGATPGLRVNLERPVRADGRLGGHFVLGHVDGVGRIVRLVREGHGGWLDVDVPPQARPYLIPKGSIALDGVSLTIATLEAEHVGVQLVPFTLEHTALGDRAPGDAVNVEVDVLGKYVARLMERFEPDVGAAEASARGIR